MKYFIARNWKLLAGAFAILAAMLALWGLLRPYAFNGLELQPPQEAADFTLTGHTGEPMSLSDYRGKLVLLYFGYTRCPDVCSTTLTYLRQARESLGEKADQVQVVMITVDPERDKASRLADYIGYFDPSFVALTGTTAQIAEVATYYNVFYEKQYVESAAGYLMGHTASVMLIDREGYLRVIYPFGTEPEELASDLEHLIKKR